LDSSPEIIQRYAIKRLGRVSYHLRSSWVTVVDRALGTKVGTIARLSPMTALSFEVVIQV
jgi:hypothetical protein